jgi:O-antigen ligase
MARARSAAAVLPALLPGLLVVLLAFSAGGFGPRSWAPLALVLAVALALRIVIVDRPFAGFSPWTAAATGALALLGAWVLLSSSWSHAPGRATVEFVRLLAYLLVLVVCGSLAPREHRLAWGIRGVAVAIAGVCVTGLITRLRPDLLSEVGYIAGRLDYPVTYWNGLGILAGVGAILALHLSASSREPWFVRVPAAGLVPIAVCTMYFTLSRGGIAASVIGAAVYVVLGFSRSTPGALLAIAPPVAIALQKAYDAERLVTDSYADAAGRAQGKEVLGVLVICIGAAIALRAAALLVDRLMLRAPSPGPLPLPARIGAAAGVALVAAIVLIAVGAPGYAERQVNLFLDQNSIADSADPRARLTVFNSNGRVDHWNAALDAWRTDRLKGTGAGTYQNTWNRYRDANFQVLDAHSLYFETLSEMGVVGLALLLAMLGSLLGGLAWRLGGRGRPEVAAVLAATLAWVVHAGVDWDWELTSVSVWMFGLAGLALARREPAAAGAGIPRLLRIVAALGCLVLALVPWTLWRSQVHLEEAFRAFDRSDCRQTVDSSLDSLGALGARAEPWELIAYCDVRLGQPKLAEGAANAAVARDPDNWEYHYALALVRGANGKDPRPAAAEAHRLNPLEGLAADAVKAFRTDRPAAWERRARKLPLFVP